MPVYPPGVRAPEHRVEKYCDSCRGYDTHPRHIILRGDGSVAQKHFDCCDRDGCADSHGICGTVLRVTRRAHGDALVAWVEGRMAALGGDLTAWLKAGGPVMGGASGLDANRLDDFLAVAVGQSAPSAGTAVLASGFNSGASSHGHIRLMTVVGSSTVNGTELAGGSYVPGTGIVYSTGSGGAFTAPSYSSGSGSTQTSATLSQAGMPAATVNGLEIWDSAGTPLRWLWGALASAITTNNGDTFTFGSGAVQATIVG